MITPGGAVADVDEAFMALLCADEDLLCAEFEAIVGAAWPPVPTPRGSDGPSGDPGPRARPQGRRRSATLRAPTCELGPVAPGRERSPPGVDRRGGRPAGGHLEAEALLLPLTAHRVHCTR
jgi:hypothetical protein